MDISGYPQRSSILTGRFLRWRKRKSPQDASTWTSRAERILNVLRPGDLLVVKSIDRLGRNYDEIIEQWRILTKERSVDIRVLDMPLLDTTHAKDLLATFIANLTLQVLSYCAHAERDNTRQRQMEGIFSAKARGVQFGRPKKELPDNIDELYAAWQQGECSGEELAAQCDMALGALYRKLRERGFRVRDMPRVRK